MAVVNRMLLLALVLGVAAGSSHEKVARGKAPNASIHRVVTMLENLVAQMEDEQKTDDGMYQEFSAWCTQQKAATSTSIEGLQALIEELGAKLASLYAQRTDLHNLIASLDQQIQETNTQMQTAQEKRQEERDSYLTEQSNFAASIAACGTAVGVLKDHYGEPKEPMAKPSWLNLVQQAAGTLKRMIRIRKMTVHPQLLAFLQQPNNNPYQDSRGDANNIVTQMQELSDTFSNDKESSTSEETKLQDMYNALTQEKTTMLQTLTSQRDSRQAVLNQVTIDIAQTEGAKRAAASELADEHAYLSQVTDSCSDGKHLYEMRKEDRIQETTAVHAAIKVLEPQSSAAFVEVVLDTKRQGSGAKIKQLRGANICKGCAKAASLLKQAARTFSSELLGTAAQMATQNDALKDILGALDGLVARLHEDQIMEDKHKQWCEKELSETSQRKSHHDEQVQSLAASIADFTQTIDEKVQDMQDNAQAIQTADENFATASKLRDQDHEQFEAELRDYVDALSALNSAIDVLAKFYSSNDAASAASLVQSASSATKVAPREVAPDMFSGVYERKGGKGVIQMIATVRAEFETGKADLEAAEKHAVDDFAAAKAAYGATRRDLVSQQDRLTVEKQTAENQMEQAKEDKISNEQEVASAQAYLAQLGGSCDTLLKNYESRKQQRVDEKTAIQQGRKVLEDEA